MHNLKIEIVFDRSDYYLRRKTLFPIHNKQPSCGRYFVHLKKKKQKKKKSWKLQSFAVTRHRRVFWCVLWFAEKIRNTIWLFLYLGVCDQEWANNLLSFIWNWGSSGLDDARLIVAFFYLFSTFILISRRNIWSSKRKKTLTKQVKK